MKIHRFCLFPLLLLLTLTFLGCKKTTKKQPFTEDFELLTGKDLPRWDYVQTQEDLAHLEYFKKIYDRRKACLHAQEETVRIPQAVHFIWLGPRPFPLKSVENVRTWMAKNPDWTFYFWTDRDRPTPVPGMQTRRVEEFSFSRLGKCFQKSECFAEKSDLLRYELLYKEGGVYVDHDVKCFQSFDSLNRAYDFYCGIDMPNTSSLPSCIFTTNNLIGIKPGHPILLDCMDRLQSEWDQIEHNYPGTDRDSVLNRVLHRTFWAFGQAVKAKNNQGENRDIVFPAYYFDAPSEELAIFAQHQYAGTWHETESAFEQMVRKRLMTITKKSNLLLLVVGSVSVLNLLGIATVVFYVRRARRPLVSNSR